MSQRPLDFESPRFKAAESAGVIQRISRNGARVLFAPTGGNGTGDVVRFPSGVEINVVNCVFPTLRRSTYTVEEPLIMLRASLCCDVVFQVQGAEPITFARPELTLACLPKGMHFTVDATGGVRQQGVIGYFPPASFGEVYGLEMSDLPEVLSNAIVGADSFGRIVSLPLEHRIASLVADTIDTTLVGEPRAMQYAGRLSELLAYAIEAVKTQPDVPVTANVRWRDAELAQQALRRLAENYRNPPLFNKLARELGTNSNKLQASFKAAYGVTMAAYCLERRMREAQQLLLEGKLTVSQVADRVGYAHQSNFAAAFSAQVGMSPREYKKHRAPIILTLG